MLIPLVRAAKVLLCSSLVCVPALAQAGGCAQLFAGQQPPALLNAKLAQRTTPLCNAFYASLASGLTRGPIWSAEHLTAGSVAQARGLERQGTFHEDERLPPDDRAELTDYERSGHDRGHMAPSGDMPDLDAQQQSFSLANVVPQTGALNRVLWEGIESAVRQLAERDGELYVVTGPAFGGRRVRALKGRVLIPVTTWKAVYDPGAGGAAAYRCTNVRRPKCTSLSITALADETGIDPFPAVPAAIKQTPMTLPTPVASHYARSGQRHPR